MGRWEVGRGRRWGGVGGVGGGRGERWEVGEKKRD